MPLVAHAKKKAKKITHRDLAREEKANEAKAKAKHKAKAKTGK